MEHTGMSDLREFSGKSIISGNLVATWAIPEIRPEQMRFYGWFIWGGGDVNLLAFNKFTISKSISGNSRRVVLIISLSKVIKEELRIGGDVNEG